jgi:hypothetical protein
VESSLLGTVQLAIADAVYAGMLRDAIARSGPWHVELIDHPDSHPRGVLVLDESTFPQLPLPLISPEQVVLITPQDPQLLAQAWDAGIVSVVSHADSVATVLLAIMAASLRVPKHPDAPVTGEISPNLSNSPASIPSDIHIFGPKRCKSR